MNKTEKYLMRFVTVLCLIIGYYSLLYVKDDTVSLVTSCCGLVGLMSWGNWNGDFS